MKNKVLLFAFSLISVFGLVTGVDAKSATKAINKNACETVYTNYYFFLEANTEDYFNQAMLDPKNYSHTTRAVYENNSYLAKFDQNNIGYGKIEVSTSSKTNGLKSLSLDDFYDMVLKANKNHGAYTSGSNNYISSHKWHKNDENGNWVDGNGSLSISNLTKEQLSNASINANTDISIVSPVDYGKVNPFTLQISRGYIGHLTGSPVTIGKYKWYLQPAAYYIQYCAPKEAPSKPEVTDTYTVKYIKNTNDVVHNMPADDKKSIEEDTVISDKIPRREGYKFLGWSPDSKSTVGDKNYAPKTPYTDRKDLILYAIWEKVEEPKEDDPKEDDPKEDIVNPQTGIEDYIIPAGAIMSISGYSLYVLKHKKSYKQF